MWSRRGKEPTILLFNHNIYLFSSSTYYRTDTRNILWVTTLYY